MRPPTGANPLPIPPLWDTENLLRRSQALSGALRRSQAQQRAFKLPIRRDVAIEKMEQGDPQFWRMLLDRVWPTKMALSEEQPQVVTFRWVSPNERENDLG